MYSIFAAQNGKFYIHAYKKKKKAYKNTEMKNNNS